MIPSWETELGEDISFRAYPSRAQPIPYVVKRPLVGPAYIESKTESLMDLPVAWTVIVLVQGQDAIDFEAFLDTLKQSNMKFTKLVRTELGTALHELQIVGNRPRSKQERYNTFTYTFTVYSDTLQKG